MELSSSNLNSNGADDSKIIAIDEQQLQAAKVLSSLEDINNDHSRKRKVTTDPPSPLDQELLNEQPPLKKSHIDHTVALADNLGMKSPAMVPNFNRFKLLLRETLIDDGQIGPVGSGDRPPSPELDALSYRDKSPKYLEFIEIVKRISSVNNGSFPGATVIYTRPTDKVEVSVEGTISYCAEEMYKHYYPGDLCSGWQSNPIFSGVEDAFLVMCCLDQIGFAFIDESRHTILKNMAMDQEVSKTYAEDQTTNNNSDSQPEKQQSSSKSSRSRSKPKPPTATTTRSSSKKETQSTESNSPESKSAKSKAAKPKAAKPKPAKPKPATTKPAAKTNSAKSKSTKSKSAQTKSTKSKSTESKSANSMPSAVRTTVPTGVVSMRLQIKQLISKEEDKVEEKEEEEEDQEQEQEEQEEKEKEEKQQQTGLAIPVSGLGHRGVSTGLRQQQTKNTNTSNDPQEANLRPREIDLAYHNMRSCLGQFHGVMLKQQEVYYMVAPSLPRHELKPIYSFVVINTDAFKSADSPSRVQWPCKAACVLCLLEKGKTYNEAYFTFANSQSSSNMMKHVLSRHGFMAEVRFICFRPHPDRVLDHAILSMALSMDVPLQKLCSDMQMLRAMGFHFADNMLETLPKSVINSLTQNDELVLVVEEEAGRKLDGALDSLYISSAISSFDGHRGKIITLECSSYETHRIVFGIIVFHELLPQPGVFMSTYLWSLIRKRVQDGTIVFSDVLKRPDFITKNMDSKIAFFNVDQELTNIKKTIITAVKTAAQKADAEQKHTDERDASVFLLIDIFDNMIGAHAPTASVALDWFVEYPLEIRLPEAKTDVEEDARLPHEHVVNTICSDFNLKKQIMSDAQFEFITKIGNISKNSFPYKEQLIQTTQRQMPFKYLNPTQQKFVQDNFDYFIELFLAMITPLVYISQPVQSHGNLLISAAAMHIVHKSVFAVSLPNDAHPILVTFQDEFLSLMDEFRQSTSKLLNDNKPQADNLMQYLASAFNLEVGDGEATREQLDILRLLCSTTPSKILKPDTQLNHPFAPASQANSSKDNAHISLFLSFLQQLFTSRKMSSQECPKVEDFTTAADNFRLWWRTFGAITQMQCESGAQDASHQQWVSYLIKEAQELDGVENRGFVGGNETIARLAWLKANVSLLDRINMAPTGSRSR